MTKYKPIQKPAMEGRFTNGVQWQIYEEFGHYGIYIYGRLKFVADTLEYALKKVQSFDVR